MSAFGLAADARVLWRMLRGQPRTGSHAERLQGFYASQATRYDVFRARLLQGREALIADLDIRPGARIVDLGCGTGSNLAVMARACALSDLAGVHLIDLCPALLDQARQRARGHANIEVAEADAAHWRPALPVDRVLLSYSLSMMPDWPDVLDNAHAMLAPGGLIGVVDFRLPHHGPGRWFWRAWFSHDGVHLTDAHLPALQARFRTRAVGHGHAPLPYLPGAHAHHYRFVGAKD